MKNINNENCNFKKRRYEDEGAENIKRKPNTEYSYYSRVLQKPFDSIEELREAEAVYAEQIVARENKAAAKKNEAKKVEDAFKALNVARKAYKDELITMTNVYQAELGKLKSGFDNDRKRIDAALADAEKRYEDALKDFTSKYPEGYHLTLKDGDFETTISGRSSAQPAADNTALTDLFALLFNL